jgi:hypothetical protein
MVLFTSSFMTLFSWAVRALDLLKAHACNYTMEVAQGACIVDLESDNVRLRSELKQARQALAKADAA